ncbi:GntR family transcriptional regulator [Oceanobacillus senegalensis]|uniref:GntR family transcriptional regulator n=1 Tax=Oceanobacillus senegalensis TaxID=1936063 RepID=UPI00318422C7
MIAISVNKETLIVDDLMQEILMKKRSPGSKLPSENELADKYHVPRFTARNALNKLEERGYIYSKQGKGRFLNNESIQIQLSLTGKVSFTEKMENMGYELKTENICCERITYDPTIFRILNVDEKEEVFQIGRLRYIDEEPIAIHYSFVSRSKFPNIVVDGPNILSMFSYYREYGINQFASNKTLLSVTFPTSEEQEMLSSKSMVPLIVVESDCIDAETGNVLEHTKIVYRSDRFKYDITMDA